MKLSNITNEDHWRSISKAPYLDPKVKVKKRHREMSHLLEPKDRDRFIKWGLSEGISKKWNKLLKIIKLILGKSPRELLSIANMRAENIFYPILLVENSSVTVKAPKGEFAEIARGKDHRAVALRFIDNTGKDKILYFVIPLLGFDGEEVTDNQARSAIQSRLKDIYKHIQDGIDVQNILNTIFVNPQAAIAKLKEIDRQIVQGSEIEREQMARQAPDPFRDQIIGLLQIFNDSKLIEKAMKLHPGMLEKIMSVYKWSPDLRAEFISASAQLADNPTPNPVKSMAELALAYIAKGALEEVNYER